MVNCNSFLLVAVALASEDGATMLQVQSLATGTLLSLEGGPIWDGGEWKELGHACHKQYCYQGAKERCKRQYHSIPCAHQAAWEDGKRCTVVWLGTHEYFTVKPRVPQPPSLGDHHWDTCSGSNCTEFCKQECRACGGELPPPLCEDQDPRCHADSEEKQRHICNNYGRTCQKSCDWAAQKGLCRKIRDAVPTCQDVLLFGGDGSFTSHARNTNFCTQAVVHHTWRQSLGDETGGPTCSNYWQVCQVTCPKAAANGLCRSPTLLQNMSDTAFAIPEGPRSLPIGLALAEATTGGNKDLEAQVNKH